MLDPRLNTSWWALRLAYGLVPIVAGLDKFTNVLTNWTDYLAPFLPQLLHISPSSFMHVVGIVEIAAGALVLTRYVRYGAYVVGAWLLLIALSLLTTGHYFDVAVRDVVLALGAYTLAELSAVKGAVHSRASDAGPVSAKRSPA